MSWGDKRYIPSAEDIARMRQIKRDKQALIDKMYKKDYSSDLENMWKALAELVLLGWRNPEDERQPKNSEELI